MRFLGSDAGREAELLADDAADVGPGDITELGDELLQASGGEEGIPVQFPLHLPLDGHGDLAAAGPSPGLLLAGGGPCHVSIRSYPVARIHGGLLPVIESLLGNLHVLGDALWRNSGLEKTESSNLC